jgi:hypothetical protein
MNTIVLRNFPFTSIEQIVEGLKFTGYANTRVITLSTPHNAYHISRINSSIALSALSLVFAATDTTLNILGRLSIDELTLDKVYVLTNNELAKHNIVGTKVVEIEGWKQFTEDHRNPCIVRVYDELLHKTHSVKVQQENTVITYELLYDINTPQ